MKKIFMKSIIINGEEYVKNGKNKDGKQKYKRKSDGKIITEGVKQKCSKDEKIWAVLLYLNGLTMNKIAILFGVSCTSVMRWIDSFTEEIKNNNQISNIQSIKDIEIDELFTFLDSKKKDLIFLQPLIERHII